MSLEREARMCEALGITSPKRPPRRFYRPCLSIELGEQIKLHGIDVEAALMLAIDLMVWNAQHAEKANAYQAQ